MRKALVIASVMLVGGCGLNKESDIPPMNGPSTLGTSLLIRVTPDTLIADGTNRSLVEGIVMDNNGNPLPGKVVNFRIQDSASRAALIGKLSTNNATSDANGVATTVYTVPARTDSSVDQSIFIVGRIVSNDSMGQIDHKATVFLLSAEGRLLPPSGEETNVVPVCSFLLEPRSGPYYVNAGIPIQTTSNDPDGIIIRYEWDFGDNTKDDRPDLTKIYKAVGTYTITHVVTDNLGGVSTCGKTIGVSVKP